MQTKQSNTLNESVTTLKWGIVSAIKNGSIKATLQDCDDLVTDWLPVVIFGDTQNNKSYAMPSVGAQVALILDSRGEDGVCLGSIYSSVDAQSAPNDKTTHTKYNDGAVIEYNPVTSTLTATDIKDLIVTAKGDINITAKGALNIDAQSISVKSQSAATISAPASITLDTPATLITGGISFGVASASRAVGTAFRATFNIACDLIKQVNFITPPKMPDAQINGKNYNDHIHVDSIGGDTDPPS